MCFRVTSVLKCLNFLNFLNFRKKEVKIRFLIQEVKKQQKIQLQDKNICPYNKKHIITRKNYFKHLKICPQRPKNQFFINEAKNKIFCDLKSSGQQIQINLLSNQQINDFSCQIDKIFSEKLNFHFFQKWSELFKEPVKVKGNQSKKSLDDLQCQLLYEQIAQNIDLKQFWDNKVKLNIIEPGSGTGKLSVVLSRQFKSEDTFSDTFQQNQIIRNNLLYQYKPSNKFQYILLERDAGYKGNFDNGIRRNGSRVYRFQADIRDIDLQNILNLSQNETISEQNLQQQQQEIKDEDIQNSIIIAKHCCNGATDSVLNWIKDMKFKPKLILIATCCHSKGDGTGYINQKYCEQLNITKELNEAIHRACAWQFSFSYQDEITDIQKAKFITGQKCRRILEIGRCLWLEEQGYKVKVVQYCDRSVSQECFCIIGKLL